jgi:DNA-binding NtrC family response regulator
MISFPGDARVLVLDDEDIVRESLADYFTECGAEVESFSEGEEALRELSSRRFDLAVVDIRLPRMDGNKFIEHAYRISPETHFFIHTGSMNYQLPQALCDIGLSERDVFIKPLGSYDAIVEAYAGKHAKP